MLKPLPVFLCLAAIAAAVAWIKVAPGMLAEKAARSAAATAQAAPQPRPLPDFQLTDQNKQPVTKADLAGKVWVANFIFSTCPGACLDLTKHMHQLEQALADNDKVWMVSFSIDPTNDTPEKLKAYSEQVGAGPRWLFLTGDRKITAKVANDGFLFPLSTDPTSFDHSERIAVVDATGTVRGWFDCHAPNLKEDVKKLISTL